MQKKYSSSFLGLILISSQAMAANPIVTDTCEIPSAERKEIIKCQSVYRSVSDPRDTPGLLNGAAIFLLIRDLEVIQSTVDESKYCIEVDSKTPDFTSQVDGVYLENRSTTDASLISEEMAVQIVTSLSEQEGYPRIRHIQTYVKGWMSRENADGSEGVVAGLMYSATRHKGVGIAMGQSPNMTCEEP